MLVRQRGVLVADGTTQQGHDLLHALAAEEEVLLHLDVLPRDREEVRRNPGILVDLGLRGEKLYTALGDSIEGLLEYLVAAKLFVGVFFQTKFDGVDVGRVGILLELDDDYLKELLQV